MDSLFKGDIFHFYTNCLDPNNYIYYNPGELYDTRANYPIIDYATIGLFCLPAYLVSKLFSFKMPFIIYHICIKLGLAVLAIAISNIVYLTVSEIEELKKYKDVIKICSLTCPFIIYCSLTMSHFDIYSTFFISLGLYALVRKKCLQELVFFSLAFAYKPFPIVVMLPIIILQDSRILYILRNIAITVVTFGIEYFLWGLTDSNYFGVIESHAQDYGFINKFFYSGFTSYHNYYYTETSYFVIFFAILCMTAYCVKKYDFHDIIYFAFAAQCIFAIFMSWFPYWLIHFAPFLIIIPFFSNRKHVYFLLESIIALFMIIISALGFPTAYDNDMIYGGVFNQISFNSIASGNELYILIENKLASIPYEFWNSFFAAAVSCIFVIATYDWIVHRLHMGIGNIKIDLYDKTNESKNDYGWIILRIVPYILFVIYAIAVQ